MTNTNLNQTPVSIHPVAGGFAVVADTPSGLAHDGIFTTVDQAKDFARIFYKVEASLEVSK